MYRADAPRGRSQFLARKTPRCRSSFALLAEEPVEIQNVPKLKDIDTTMKLLAQLGRKSSVMARLIDASNVNNFSAPYDT